MRISPLVPLAALVAATLLPQGTHGAETETRNMLAPTQWSPKEKWQRKGSHWNLMSDDSRGAVIRLMKKPVVLEQDIQTDGGIAKVQLSGEIRIQDLQKNGRWGTASIRIEPLDAEGKLIEGNKGAVKFFHENTDWNSFDLELDVPADTYTLHVVLEFRAIAGTADYANLILKPTELREAPERKVSRSDDVNTPENVKVEYPEHSEWHKDPPQKPMEQWQADIDPTAYKTTIFVAADGSGDGTEGKPMGSIKTALDKAAQLIRDGVPTRIFLSNGTYRQSWFPLDAEKIGGKAQETLLVIEGESQDGVRILGSTTEGVQPDQWKLVDKERNVYRLDWTRTELKPVPTESWNPAIAPISRHRVMVFVNGVWLKPVQLEQYRHEKKEEKYEREHGGISTRRSVTDIYTGFAGLDSMEPGTLAVNTLGPGENNFDEHPHDFPNSLLIRLPEGIDFESATVEVVYRAVGGFQINKKDNLVMRNLTIKHMGIAAIRVDNSNNILVENFEISEGDGGGGASALRFYEVTHLTLRNGSVSDNGTFGVALITKFATVDNLKVNNNNWRGGLSDNVMHGQGGMGTYFSHMIIRNSEFNRNYGAGLRQDVLGEHVLIENCQFNFNQRSGMFWEISYGPATVRNSEIIGNLGYGVHVLNMHGLTFENVKIVNNRDAQFSVFAMLNRGKIIHQGTPRFSGPQRWPLGGQPHEGYWIEGILNMKIIDCTVAVTDPALIASPLIKGKYWSADQHYIFDWLVNQLDANNNLYWHAVTKQVFDIGKGNDYGTLAQWQEVTGEDMDSVWKKPDAQFPNAVAPADSASKELQLHRE